MLIERDQVSYQARLEGDNFFFLRRLIEPADHLTSLNFGALPPLRQPVALHHFMVLTGGWPLKFIDVDIGADASSDASMIATLEERIKSIMDRAIPWANVSCVERITHRRKAAFRMYLTPL